MSRLTTVDQIRFPLAIRVLNKCGALLDGAAVRYGQAQRFVDAAKTQCQLEDFGEGDFIEPLARLLHSCLRDARLNLIGKFALRADVTQHLCSRLLLQRERQTQPLIARGQIVQPLFIVGLPRSGTTLLHTLLAADPEHRAPLTWEVMAPSPQGGEDPRRRRQRVKKNLSRLEWLAPQFCRVHATGAELPQECVSLMSPSFLSDQFDTMYNVPHYRAWFLRQDLLPAYTFHRQFLQHLQHMEPMRRWILKAPAHMFALSSLLSTYPDAIFVQSHRAPLQAIASVSSLITILRRVFSDAVDARTIGAEALQYWSDTLARFMAQRDRILPGRVCDLRYQDIQRDPLTAISEVYDHFGWKFSFAAESRMRQVLAQQRGDLRSFHRYHFSQFGFRAEDETEFFGNYCERFDLFSADTCGFASSWLRLPGGTRGAFSKTAPGNEP